MIEQEMTGRETPHALPNPEIEERKCVIKKKTTLLFLQVSIKLTLFGSNEHIRHVLFLIKK
jgi:hypothetical protein